MPGDRTTGERPRFGEWFEGTKAAEDNPQKRGMYVRTIRRRGRMNAGTFYELTDGRGNFWEYPVELVARAEGERRADPYAPTVLEQAIADAIHTAQCECDKHLPEHILEAIDAAGCRVLRREGLLGAGLDLSPVGQIAMLAAKSALSRGEAPGPNTVGTLVIEIDRLRSLSGRQGPPVRRFEVRTPDLMTGKCFHCGERRDKHDDETLACPSGRQGETT